MKVRKLLLLLIIGILLSIGITAIIFSQFKVKDLDVIDYRPILTKSMSDKIMQELIKFATT